MLMAPICIYSPSLQLCRRQHTYAYTALSVNCLSFMRFFFFFFFWKVALFFIPFGYFARSLFSVSPCSSLCFCPSLSLGPSVSLSLCLSASLCLSLSLSLSPSCSVSLSISLCRSLSHSSYKKRGDLRLVNSDSVICRAGHFRSNPFQKNPRKCTSTANRNHCLSRIRQQAWRGLKAAVSSFQTVLSNSPNSSHEFDWCRIFVADALRCS